MNEEFMYSSNGESTSTVSKVSYEIEKLLVKNKNKNIGNYINELKKNNKFPPNLKYVDSYYDEKTGTSGSAFLDTNTGKIVLGYAGTNMDADGIKDILTDITLVPGNTGHVSAAVKFYEELAKQGYPITLTGHSLGGNIAALVALITNNPTTITFNGAPLSVSNYLLNLLDAIPDKGITELYKGFILANKNHIEDLINRFNGNITRFVSEKDELNAAANIGKGVYIGNEYILYNNNPHSIDLFLDEDIQNYINAIIDLEQHKTVTANIGVDVDGDGTIDVLRSARQLVVKDLLGMPGSNGGGSGKKIKINPETLLNLSVNLQGMSQEDVAWIDANVTQCEKKNESIKSSFETRKTTLNHSVIEGITNSGLGTLLTGIDDSFAKIKEKKQIIKTVENFNSYNITRKFDSLGASGKRTWFKGGIEWTPSDVSDFGNKLKKLMTASSILLHNIETKGEFEYATPEGIKIYHYDTITDISRGFVNVTNALEPKITKTFKGLGLREGKNDGISQSLTEVFSVEHQNTSELTKSLSNISSLTSSIAINYQEKDEWIKSAIEGGNTMASPNAINVPKTYDAFLKDTTIFDDVKDVLQAFDKQVEERSLILSKKISASYTEIIDKFDAKTRVVREGMNEFKKMILAISKEMDDVITYEEEITKLVPVPVDPKLPAGSTMPATKLVKEIKKGNSGTLGSHFPSDVQSAIQDAETAILPLLDVFNAVLTASQTFNSGVNTMESYLKSIVEKAVYTALDLDEIIKVQMLSIEVVSRMISELSNLDNSLKGKNQGLAIESLSSQVHSVKKLLGYFDKLIQNCFGEQGSGGKQSTGGNKGKTNSYSGKF